MDDNPEVIRKQMEETRSALGEKLEALESQVTETVKETTSAVTETVEAVKDTVENVTGTVKETVENVTEGVHETVKSVAQTLDIRGHVERHPWLMFGGSVVAGCVAGYLLSPPSWRRGTSSGSWFSSSQTTPSRGSAAYASQAQPAASSTTSSTVASTAAKAANWLGSEASWLGGEAGGWLGEQFKRLKGLAIGTLMGVIRDLAKQSLPEALKDRVTQEVDQFTTSLGGEPIHGQILPESVSSGAKEDSEEKHQTRGQQPAMAGARHG
jgi:ElaB/YqjD/DUF883 family membrane-anchored ribosome-binding protein